MAGVREWSRVGGWSKVESAAAAWPGDMSTLLTHTYSPRKPHLYGSVAIAVCRKCERHGVAWATVS